MKSAWAVLIITAITDYVMTFATALLTVMQITKEMPNAMGLLTASLGALIIAGRTIQQALKATPQTTAELKGDQPPIVLPANLGHIVVDALKKAGG